MAKDSFIINFWKRRGDSLIFIFVIITTLLWLWYFLIFVPGQKEYGEGQELIIYQDRELTVVDPYPEGEKLGMGFGSRPIDAVVTLDVSGSMEDNDPDKLAMMSGRLFTDLLNPGDRLGVIFFAGRHNGIENEVMASYPLTEIPSLTTQQGRTAIKNLFDYPYNGGTNYNPPLKKALQLFTDLTDERGRVNLFLTDGGHDPQYGPVDSSFRDVFRKNNIKLFPIGFGKELPPETFSITFPMMSYEQPQSVNKPEELPTVFADIFSQLRDSKAIAPDYKDRKYTFEIPDEVIGLDMVIISDKVPKLEYRLDGANTKRVDISSVSPDLYISQEEKYIVIKLSEDLINNYRSTKTNSWTFGITPKPDTFLLIPTYSFSMETVLGSFNEEAKTGRVSSIRLVDENGETVVDPAVSFFAVLDGPEGRYEAQLTDEVSKGVFSGDVPFSAPGEYTFFFQARKDGKGGYRRTSDSRSMSFREKVNYQLDSAHTFNGGTVKKGQILPIQPVILPAETVNSQGEKFDLSLSLSGNPKHIKLMEDKIHITTGNDSGRVEIRTIKGIPFILPSTKKGSYVGTLDFNSSSGEFSIPIKLDVLSMSFHEALVSLLITAALLIINMTLLIGRMKYTPFGRSFNLLVVTRASREAFDVTHPGNHWLFGKPKYWFGDDGYLEAGYRSVYLYTNQPSEEKNPNYVQEGSLSLGSDYIWYKNNLYFLDRKKIDISELKDDIIKKFKKCESRYGNDKEIKKL